MNVVWLFRCCSDRLTECEWNLEDRQIQCEKTDLDIGQITNLVKLCISLSLIQNDGNNIHAALYYAEDL